MDHWLTVGSVRELILRIRGEYLEMPGMALTLAQARRLWGFDEATCRDLLQDLVDAGFLAFTPGGHYILADRAAARIPPLRAAKTAVEPAKPSRRAVA